MSECKALLLSQSMQRVSLLTSSRWGMAPTERDHQRFGRRVSDGTSENRIEINSFEGETMSGSAWASMEQTYLTRKEALRSSFRIGRRATSRLNHRNERAHYCLGIQFCWQ